MLDDILKTRKAKRDKLEHAYPSHIERTHAIGEMLKQFGALTKNEKNVTVAGRIMGLRDQGSMLFLDMVDQTGKLQIVVKKEEIKTFESLQETVDIGDFISATGTAFETKRGEKSIRAKKIAIIAKSLRPLPSQWHGLKDVEERFRKRYLDLLLNSEVKEKIIARAELNAALRKTLNKEGFIEVETPLLQPLAGGALAEPFVTHHNALDTDFYLRIAPELYLKRLLIGGFEKIYEIGRVFRNEGMDRDHNPEFTMMELYMAYADWEQLMKLTQKLLKKYLPGKWQKITFTKALKTYAKKDIKKLKEDEIDEVFKKEVRPHLKEPTLVTHYPKSISPLAKACVDDETLTERFQLIVDGMEIANGFSELNDPIEQRRRMREQEQKYRAGDKEASRLDEDFLEALEYGMPPAAGLGIGIDRLAAIATKSHNIKEVIAFPTLKPKWKEERE